MKTTKLEKTRTVGVRYSLSLSMQAGLEKNRLDVPSDGEWTDPQLLREGSGRKPFCQQFQDLDFPAS